MKWQSKKNEDEELVDESEYENVRTVGNCIYFYTDVSMESILELTAQLKKLSNELRNLSFSEVLTSIREEISSFFKKPLSSLMISTIGYILKLISTISFKYERKKEVRIGILD